MSQATCASREDVLLFAGVSKLYPRRRGGERVALRNVNLRLAAGQVLAIMGRSGSGKSTLLNLAAGIDVPSSGRVLLLGHDLDRLSERERTRVRRDGVGLVFQFFHLLAHLTVEENVALPELIAGGSAASFRPRVAELLERVGLADRAGDRVDTLSGGEMQRVAICRAVMRRPRLLLADEPTGNLDDATGRTVMDLLLDLARLQGSSLIFATHDAEVASLADDIRHLHSGVLDAT